MVVADINGKKYQARDWRESLDPVLPDAGQKGFVLLLHERPGCFSLRLIKLDLGNLDPFFVFKEPIDV